MASVSVRCGGGGVSCCGSGGGRTYLRAPSNRNATLTMAMIGGARKETVAPMSISVAATTDVSRVDYLQKSRERRRQEEAVSHGNLIDEWMRDSVVEIVKNLRDAPLLVHVYSDGDDKSGATRLKTEKAAPGDWLSMKKDWENGTAPKPEGVIFVEQLREENRLELEPEEESETVMDFEGASTFTRAWGVVVQGRGENCGPACYLLKTSRVGAGPGTGSGLCCTHFCLVKVKSFRETAESQFKNCWLLNGK